MKTSKPHRKVARPTPISDDELSSVTGGSEMAVTKQVNKASPALFKNCCVGTHYPTVAIEL